MSEDTPVSASRHLSPWVVIVVSFHLWLLPVAVLDVTLVTQARAGHLWAPWRLLVSFAGAGVGALVGLVPATVFAVGFWVCWVRFGVINIAHGWLSAILTALSVLVVVAVAVDAGLVGAARSIARGVGAIPGQRAYLGLALVAGLAPFGLLVPVVEAALLRLTGKPVGDEADP
ncbi:hypothetical protein GRX03_01170 [Halovenus sp. WSH3]|uniref:Uncharacterized protein n=1 Tax=Halovenus carboxidivorans TaxID=2692199 RepID=A0A6B0T4R9_9EURY|nr:hypothetical protein [Halovenus carboxidivorans]MXR50221.1 hypothetical protein [Halovenus carboxidivorans]